MMPPKYRIACHVGPHHDLYHLALALTCLQALKDHGHADVQFTGGSSSAPVPFEDPLTFCLEVMDQETGTPSLVAIDLRDRSDYVSPRTLERVDFYFKRSFQAADLLYLPQHLRRRVAPFSPNYACRSGASARAVLRALTPPYALHLMRFSRDKRRLLSCWSDRFRAYLGSPAPEVFERGPAVRARPLVLFQTRLWMPSETGSDDAEAINEGRIAIVRALRREFGRRFRGGVVPTPYARRRCPDAVTTEPCSRAEYIAFIRQGLVGVYTPGIHQSLAFKFAEYLAASLCVVGRGVRDDALVPLTPGKEYLPFETPDECVASCARLLDDASLADHYRAAAWRYYEVAIRPPAPLLNCLRYLAQEQQPIAPSAADPSAARHMASRGVTVGRAATRDAAHV